MDGDVDGCDIEHGGMRGGNGILMGIIYMYVCMYVCRWRARRKRETGGVRKVGLRYQG